MPGPPMPTHLPSPGPALDPRGEEPGAIQQRAVVVVANKVPELGRLVAGLQGRNSVLISTGSAGLWKSITWTSKISTAEPGILSPGARNGDVISWGHGGCSRFPRRPLETSPSWDSKQGWDGMFAHMVNSHHIHSTGEDTGQEKGGACQLESPL